MVYLEWDDAFLIGIEELDGHHMHLLELLNRAYSACMLNNPVADLKAVVAELSEYTGYHFSAEELAMDEIRYPGLAEQKLEHEKFSHNLSGLIRKIENNDACTTIELVELTEFLANWIKEHIVNLDNKFGAFIINAHKQ